MRRTCRWDTWSERTEDTSKRVPISRAPLGHSIRVSAKTMALISASHNAGLAGIF